jgi:nucleoid DNA-binding protein
MSKTEFISAVHAKNPHIAKSDVVGLINSMSEVVAEALKTSGEVTIPGVVKLKAVKKAATAERQGINPFTKQAVTIAAKPESTKVKTSPVKAIKDAVG